MVIRDSEDKIVILLEKRDILDYVFEKCGFEVGIEIKEMVDAADDEEEDTDDEDIELNLAYKRISDLEDDLAELKESQEVLEGELNNQKETYIKYLKQNGMRKAAKLLEELDD